jgi:hypothetical protein
LPSIFSALKTIEMQKYEIMLIKTISLIIFIVLIKVVYNLYYFISVKRYFKKYQEYIDNKKDWYIQGHRQKIIKIFEKANLRDCVIPNIEPMGYGYVNTNGISLFNNIAILENDIATQVVKYLKESEYVYKTRMFDAINPVYWIESFVFLPKIILQYLGVKIEGLIIKIFQIVWWLIVFVSTIIGIFFNENFSNWIRSIL